MKTNPLSPDALARETAAVTVNALGPAAALRGAAGLLDDALRTPGDAAAEDVALAIATIEEALKHITAITVCERPEVGRWLARELDLARKSG